MELGSSGGGQWHLLREILLPQTLMGIDLYEPFVIPAQKAGLPILLGFVEDMPQVVSERFDLVCSRHVLEHLGDVTKGMNEIKRITKVGGYSAHVTPDMPVDNEPAHLNKWPLYVWVKVWEEHGWEIIHASKEPYNYGESHIVARRVK